MANRVYGANNGNPEFDWLRRIPVWACDHLWVIAESGDQEAREAIADAAGALATDFGENVALCCVCETTEQHIAMTRRWVNSFWLDGDHQTLIDVGDSQDGPSLPAFNLVESSPAPK